MPAASSGNSPATAHTCGCATPSHVGVGMPKAASTTIPAAPPRTARTVTATAGRVRIAPGSRTRSLVTMGAAAYAGCGRLHPGPAAPRTPGRGRARFWWVGGLRTVPGSGQPVSADREQVT